jgi:hypothetical protein
VPVPEVEGVLVAADVAATVDAIAAVQQPDGMIPWWEGGHADPWNHVEAAMALDVGGRRAAAERAYEWLAATQRPDGAWHQYYVTGGVEEATLDANVCAYVATGTWHHWRTTGDRGFLEAMWPVVERAVDWVLDLQRPGGEIVWARHPDGRPWTFALVTGSSSIAHSLRRAVAVAEAVGVERPDWELSADLLADAVAHRPDAFAPKDRWAMDWYYPVLAGVLRGPAATARLASRRHEFVLPGAGVRCVADRPWATAAETAECALAHLAAGERATALELFTWAQGLRDDDGAYFTGIVLPERVHFPGGERSTYTAAAVVLAADALDGRGPAADLFTAPEAAAPADLDDVTD